MIKKREDLQIYILLAIGGALILFLFNKFNTPYPILNLILTTSKWFITPIMFMCFISPLVNFLSQKSDSSLYDNLPYERLTRAYIHLSSILLMTFIFSWILFFFILFLLWLTNNIKIALIIPSIIITVVILVIDALVQKNWKIRWYQFFYWTKWKPS